MTKPDPSTRRRRAFLAILTTVAAATVAFAFLGPRPDPAREGSDPPAQPAAAAEESPAEPPPPAYLAWMSGGFAPEFRARIRTLDRFEATVVIAGDTRWLTRSTDAQGAVVHDPPGSFTIPIDAFAVNPVEYEPFLPEGLREDVIGALERGEGVLSARSAEIRELGVGGTLRFGEQQVRVGAVAPDEAIGWSELLVSREVGDPLGIVDDRYLLALPSGHPGLERFADLLRPLLPTGTPLRVEKPGGTRFMRVASGVNPPIVLKEVFGEFAARPGRADPAQLTIQPRWVRSNIVTRSVPVLGRVTCHRTFLPALIRALREIERQGLAPLLRTYDGCWNARTVARSPTAPPSFHAYGAAIDVNAAGNGYGAAPTMDQRVVDVFEWFGFMWGGEFLIPDGMHFEYGEPMEAA